MAAIMQQPAQETSAARAFWQEKMQEHPNLAGLLAIAGEVAGWFLNGHFLVWLGQWVIRVSGYIAETALLFAVLWISGTSVAPHLIELVMSEQTMHYFVSVALVALALIPEIILANAIVNALSHIHTATQQRTPVAWAWAVLFTLPTLLFLGLTAYTLNSLVANGGNFVQASAGLVGLRCFAGWTYGLLEMVYAGIGRKMVNQAQPAITPAAQPVPAQIDYEEIARQLLPTLRNELKQAIPDTSGLVEQVQQMRVNLEELTVKNAPAIAPESTLRGEGMSDESAPADDTKSLTEERQEESTNITLMSDRRSAQPRTTTRTVTRSEKARKAASIIKRHPQISAPDLAKKAQISTSYARKLLVNQ